MIADVPDEEFLEPDRLQSLQRRKLTELIAEVRASNRFYRGKLGGVAFDPRHDRLDGLPFTTRTELQEDQEVNPPYGSNLTYPLDRYVRLHQTSGSTGMPLRWLDTAADWSWFKRTWETIYRAAGATGHERILFPFSFGPFIGFWAAFDSAADLGHLALAGGGMSTEARLRFLIDNAATFVCCTPTYALRMAEVAAREGIDLAASDVRGLIVAGEPGGSIAATRARIESAWGARVFDHVGMTEIGAWGFECLESPGGIHVNEAEFVAEVIDPSTTQAVEDGECGELVLTNLGRIGSPLIRYRTGDQVRLTRRRCACGRSYARAEHGILGRLDDMLIIRGNNVFPSAVEGIIREFDEVAEFQLSVTRRGAMSDLRVTVEPVDTAGADVGTLVTRLTEAIRNRLYFTPAVTIAEAGALPRFEMKARRLVSES